MATATNGANLGFESDLWRAADALRSNMDASEYKHVVLGLIFLKYISDAFEEQHAKISIFGQESNHTTWKLARMNRGIRGIASNLGDVDADSFHRDLHPLNLQVRLDGQSVWLTQAGMAELFQTTPQNITVHVRSIYEEGELAEEATCKEYLQVRSEGDRQVQRALKHYSLEMILAIGYRFRSPRGMAFRQWATARLAELLAKGFTLDDERIKAGRTLGDDYFDELLARIRDIRSSERLFYQKRMLAFYREYPSAEPKVPQPAALLPRPVAKLRAAAIVPQAVAQLPAPSTWRTSANGS